MKKKSYRKRGAQTGVGLKPVVRECVSHHFACDCREAAFRDLLQDVMDQHCDIEDNNYNACEAVPCDWCNRARRLLGADFANAEEETPRNEH